MYFGEPADMPGLPPLPISRPPVSEAPGRRTKRACLTCQRKKLKCNGLQPCTTCVSRNCCCAYGSHSPDRSRGRARAHHETSNHASHHVASRRLPQTANAFAPRAHECALETCNRSPTMPPSSTQGQESAASDINVSSMYSVVANVTSVTNANVLGESPEVPVSIVTGNRDSYEFTTGNGNGSHGAQNKPDGNGRSGATLRGGNFGGSEGERLNEQSRLLNDGKGRLLYLGDSASLSFLDTIRRLVENTLGPSEFTQDPHRHKLVEGSITVGKQPTHVLPDREAAEFLIDSFFSHTVGILYIFDRETCAQNVAQIYENPLAVEHSRLSTLNLVFAVGLQMTRSSTGHSFRESQILKRLDASPVDRAELFYLNATYLNDPIQGFEDGDISSIQTLLLITVFMLTVAKRNAAWAYFGMAVRSAYALGLHRKEIDLGFAPSERRKRRDLWQSLYVMDCFISAMLGRPNSINLRDAPQTSYAGDQDDAEGQRNMEANALTASTKASQLIGDILSNVYAERKISVKLAYRLSARFHSWKESLPSILRWQNINLPADDPQTTLAQLRVNMSYFHGIILLTRPFLLQKIIDLVYPSKGDNEVSGQSKIHGKEETSSASAEPFPAACVRSAVYSVNAVQSASLKRALPRRDPFVIYWLFSAALIVFSNGFANVCTDIDTAQTMQTALNLMQYLSEVDPLARRYNQILAAFHVAISRKETVTANNGSTATRSNTDNIFAAFFEGFGGAGISTTPRPPNASSASLDRRRDSSSNHAPSTNMDQTCCTSELPARIDWRMCWEPPSMQSNSTAGALATAREEVLGVMGTGTGTGISPPDYCLDLDAFMSVGPSHEMYGPDTRMPLYGTMDIG